MTGKRTGCGGGTRAGGFTLVELLVVVAIIAVMLSTAALSVGSGTASVRLKNAVRTTWKMSSYARTAALLRQKPVVMTYSEIWEGDTFLKSRIELKEGSEERAEGTEQSAGLPTRSIFDPDADPPAPEAPDGPDEGGGALDAEPQEFTDVRIKVEVLGDEEIYNRRKKNTGISIFSNVDYLLGRNRTASAYGKKNGANRDDKADADGEETEQETREPVSVVFEPNGRCPAHKVSIWRDGRDERDATVLEVDRFGTIKNPEAEDDR